MADRGARRGQNCTRDFTPWAEERLEAALADAALDGSAASESAGGTRRGTGEQRSPLGAASATGRQVRPPDAGRPPSLPARRPLRARPRRSARGATVRELWLTACERMRSTCPIQ